MSERNFEDGTREIYVMNADGSGQTRLTNYPSLDVYPSWSPDGTKIAFVRDSYIFVMDPFGFGQKKLGDGVVGWFPDWSPDGTKIAFHKLSSPASVTNEIYVVNADGSGLKNISNDPALDYSVPSWSPDGTKIAFHRAPNDESGEIHLMNADGSGKTGALAIGFDPDFGPKKEDSTPPIITVPEDIVVEATSIEGALVTYTVTAQDDVDGTATLEKDGTTITQDNVGGDITISCSPSSGSTFPVGDTEVQCSATDAAGNTGTPASFMVTVNPLPPAKAVDELISTVQDLDGDDNDVPQSVKTSLTAPLKEASDILDDDNPNNDKAACGKLGAFINQVNANESRGTLTAEEVDELRTQAEAIMNQLDC
jgi:hypothetical protein